MKFSRCSLLPLFAFLFAGSLAALTTVQTNWLGGIENRRTGSSWSAGVAPNNNASFLYSVVIDNAPNYSGVSLDQNANVMSVVIGKLVSLLSCVRPTTGAGRTCEKTRC